MFCTACGNQIPDGSTVCPSCGNRIGATSATPAAQTPVANPPASPTQSQTASKNQPPSHKLPTYAVVLITVLAVVAIGGIGASLFLANSGNDSASSSKQATVTVTPQPSSSTTSSASSASSTTSTSSTSSSASSKQSAVSPSDSSAQQTTTKGYAAFWGIWISASKDQPAAQQTANEAIAKGLNANVCMTTDWANLNTEPWYVVTADECVTQSQAESELAGVQAAGYGSAYVKYSGDFIGKH